MEETSSAPTKDHEFTSAEKQGFYKAIYTRRDIRSQFLSDPNPEETLARILDACKLILQILER